MTDETQFGAAHRDQLEQRIEALERRVETLSSETTWLRVHRYALYALVRRSNRSTWLRTDKKPGALRNFINRFRGTK